MSSYYTQAQLEKMRKARLKQELANSIRELKEQLQAAHTGTAHVTAGSHIELSVFATDDSVGGYKKSAAITGSMLRPTEHAGERPDDLDFSGLLHTSRTKPSKLELELDAWLKRVDERPVLTEDDERDRARLLAELSKTTRDASVDIEDKVKFVKMRVSTYLQGAAEVTEADKTRIQSTYYEYCALCELLGVEPVERLPYRVEKEVARMTAVLEKRREDEYVMDVIESILAELGCHAKDDAVLDHTMGQIYAVDGHPLCDVFVGNDGSGIMFEPVGGSRDGSLEQQRQVESSANSICSLYVILEERAAREGVILKRVYMEPSRIAEMCVQSDIRERKAKKKQKRNVAQKQRASGSEG